MIIQIGPYPPPYGGISIYIKRLKLKLDNLKIENYVWNTFSDSTCNGVKQIKIKFLFKEILKNKDIRVLHYNISGILGKQFVYILNNTVGRKKINIITLHGNSRDLFAKRIYFMKYILNSFDTIICVKKDDCEYLKVMGVKKPIFHIPAYINPTIEENEENKIPEYVYSFMKRSKFLISANGAITFNNNEDLYGLDILIELMSLIKYDYPNINLIFCVLAKDRQTEKEKKYYEGLKNSIINNELSERILLYEVENTEFYPILRRSDIFIRPTNTDGDAVSIREALYFNIPCLASDAVIRPKDVFIFENRNIKSLYEEFIRVIKNQDENSKDYKMKEENDVKIINLYKKLLKDREYYYE
ncbi:glycosyltransferase [Clostridium tertium]|jgi:glycosyltransferase involved in cell wall biosynthesis|nr:MULTISPECIES: glycosyltransferase [Clostridium]MBU6134390.1 glycosyltransferase [Clostridium tertium]MCR1951907.1 glycosyltransferase [Clostridium sp. DSM 100503]MDB1934341.1 glycosyltransferase [Clostridium tertium]MDB1935842.1 glycosyltransferase [Clostridium tertium]MDB1953668.1 glycosyltransferase [Clostridium tertium]